MLDRVPFVSCADSAICERLNAANCRSAIQPCRYISFIYYGYGLLLHVEYNGRTIYRFVQHAQHVLAFMSCVELLRLSIPMPLARGSG